MPRYRLTIEYDGQPFVGWQRQDNGPSVQGAIEEAAKKFSAEKVATAAAGRTDAGVHALGMTAHIDFEKEWPADVVCDALNFHLKPAPIAILKVERVSDDFHARFSATARHYLYRYIHRRAPLALEVGRGWRIPYKKLDVDAMDRAAQALVGKHDFTTFRAAQCQAKSPVKTLSAIECRQEGGGVVLRVSAPSFLHNQVRSIAGSVAQVGIGKWTQTDFVGALKAADRAACGPVAPACGLYFVRAEYPALDKRHAESGQDIADNDINDEQ